MTFKPLLAQHLRICPISPATKHVLGDALPLILPQFRRINLYSYSYYSYYSACFKAIIRYFKSFRTTATNFQVSKMYLLGYYNYIHDSDPFYYRNNHCFSSPERGGIGWFNCVWYKDIFGLQTNYYFLQDKMVACSGQYLKLVWTSARTIYCYSAIYRIALENFCYFKVCDTLGPRNKKSFTPWLFL